MKSFDTDLKKYAEKISLKVSERRELRERILSYMEYHPLPKQKQRSAEAISLIPSDSFITLHFQSLYVRIVAGVAVLMLIAVPFVAERSVPGDVLYLVKTGFNETIQGQLNSSPYERVEFETKLIERRIAEARVLASEGKLTEEVESQIAQTVKEHTNAVKSGLDKIRSQDAEGAAIAEIAFNSSLEVQSASLGQGGGTDASLVGNILTVVNDARNDVALNQGSTTPSFEGLMARVEFETTRAYELFETIKKTAIPEEITDIERRLSDINRIILEAKVKHDTEVSGASTDLLKALTFIQKLIVFMTDIDIRENVALESIVPIVLSDDERIAIVEEDLQNLINMFAEVVSRIELLGNDEVNEKITGGMARIEELSVQITEALNIREIDSAEGLLKEAQAIMADLDLMTSPEPRAGGDDPTVPTLEDGTIDNTEGAEVEILSNGEVLTPTSTTANTTRS